MHLMELIKQNGFMFEITPISASIHLSENHAISPASADYTLMSNYSAAEAFSGIVIMFLKTGRCKALLISWPDTL